MTATPHSLEATTRRLRIGGQVQGVGFRPFVRRCARDLGITGSVCNYGGEVEIIAQGNSAQLAQFKACLLEKGPPLARPLLILDEPQEFSPHLGFTILTSRDDANSSFHLLADQPLCNECLQELNDSGSRRYRYPFTNCTQCGPRYTIIDRLPYDRANTSMSTFTLCPSCTSEYQDIDDRRYHAEPIACPRCGPSLHFMDVNNVITDSDKAIDSTVEALRNGAIAAVKGVGGYHLMCDARNEKAVEQLRQRKQRPAKPLAVMFPWEDENGSAALTAEAVVTPLELERLRSQERPIVLCKRTKDATLSSQISPALNEIGVLLPYSPLHHLLLDRFGGPLVATSGNVSGEPVLCDNAEAQQRLNAIADVFLNHNRPILHAVDDSLYRVIAGATRPLRLGRGKAPQEMTLPLPLTQPLLAVGGHLKNTIALAWDNRAVISPHIGDLDSPRGMKLFEETIVHLQQLYGVNARTVICDAHPDYASSRWARNSNLPVTSVLHHHAHASALYGEHHGHGDWLVFAWDGSGYGDGKSLWGGESFIGAPGHWQHFSSLLPFQLPGGEKAARQPWRTALALCWEAGYEWPLAGVDTSLLMHARMHGINTPATSAIGRLFDGVAALLGLCHEARYEGEAAMQLEAVAEMGEHHSALPLVMSNKQPLLIDWQPLMRLLFDDRKSVACKAGEFHQILADTITAVALKARMQHSIHSVGLCGGVFQNKMLSELASEQLQKHGFEVMLSTHVPCNDGGIAFGQVIEHLYLQEQTVT